MSCRFVASRFRNGARTAAAAAGVRCNHGKCAFLRANLLAFSNSRTAVAIVRRIVCIHSNAAARWPRGRGSASHGLRAIRLFELLARILALFRSNFDAIAREPRAACESIPVQDPLPSLHDFPFFFFPLASLVFLVRFLCDSGFPPFSWNSLRHVRLL